MSSSCLKSMVNSQSIGQDLKESVLNESIENEDAKFLIPTLCKMMYHQGLMTGTGGGMSIRQDDCIYIAPSGVQKERINPDDLFIYSLNGDLRQRPSNATLKASQCTPLFFNAYNIYGSGAIIHTHSQNAVMATLIYKEMFSIAEPEMMIRMKRYFQDHGIASQSNMNLMNHLVIPIIDNTPREEDLKDSMANMMKNHPEANAILVRRHGVFVWGPTWQSTKIISDYYEHLFEWTLKMHEMKSNGLNRLE